MPTPVVMPQMGESVTEGTVVRWIKQVGDAVDRDEPLFEISTDKVDAEIPSPGAGILREIRVKEGETVPVDTVVAMLGDAGEAVDAADTADASGPDGASTDPQEPRAQTTTPELESAEATADAAADDTRAEATSPSVDDVEAQREARRRTRSSPLVRNIAAEHGVDLTDVNGSGVSGRVTKRDIMAYLDDRSTDDSGRPSGLAAYAPGEEVRIEPMSVMRRKIAEHMIYSRRTSAHVHSVFEIDFARVAAVRQEKKAEFERQGVKLTYLAFIARAVCDALREMPLLNASIDGDNVVYKRDINLGIAVALDWGLIVPVIAKADEKNLLGMSRAINDLAERARTKRLKHEEVHGGTFTITNPGSLGTLFGMPIINQPQVAILAAGTIEKRVVVVDDMIAVRPRGYLTLGYDHRLVDGAVADAFMAHVKHTIEHWPS